VKERSRLIHPRIEADVAVELLVFNSTEFADQVSGSSFPRFIVDTGRVWKDAGNFRRIV
jgi:hypothetical protein